MTAATSPSQLAAALHYASLGWRVIPLHTPVMGKCDCGRSTCAPGGVHENNIGKHPRLREWQKIATTDAKAITAWWKQWPNANVGIATGLASGFWVLDIDPDKGGEQSLVELVAKHGPLPVTVEAITGSGGRHLLFRCVASMLNSTSRLGPGLDIRGDRGQIVVAPSLHRSGNSYEWQPHNAPGSTMALAPAWLLELAQPDRRAPVAPAVRHVPAPDQAQTLKRARGYLSRVPGATSGARGHDTTWNAALKMVRGFALSESDSFDLLWNEYNPRCDPPWSEKELRHKITDIINNGTAPLGFLLNVERPAATKTLTVATAAGTPAPPQQEAPLFEIVNDSSKSAVLGAGRKLPLP